LHSAKRRLNPLIAQLVVAAVLLGSLPMAASPVIAKDRSAPAFTLDICHPVPALAVSAASCALAAPITCPCSIATERRGPAEVSDLLAIDHDSEAPDPPPPKTIA
jgi:hypothetical protein